ncbi:MAG: prolipoprotein diacylglyceryl transferase [Chitinophagales bacterium]
MTQLAIHWNIHPEIFPLNDGIELRWYGFFFFLFLIFGYSYLRQALKKESKPIAIADEVFIYMALCIFIGARLAYVFIYKLDYFKDHLLEIPMFWKGGMTGHGAYIAVAIGTITYTYFRKEISLGWLADKLVIPIFFAGFCIRLGNFFNHEIVGIPTSQFWGVVFKYYNSGQFPIPRIPIQLIEGIGYLVIMLFLLFILPKKYQEKEGNRMAWALIFLFSWRLFVDIFKEDMVFTSFAGITLPFSYWLSFPFIIAGIFILSKSFFTKHKTIIKANNYEKLYQ